MFRISERRQASNERMIKAELDLLRDLTRIGDENDLQGCEEVYVLSNVLNAILKRRVLEANP